MSFSKKIKSRCLSECARHCCVCQRYCGVKIEIHHIITKEQSGEDTYENAIPLCFDCHCNAGHYNPQHPRGNRYSPEELKKSRDRLYKIVKEGRIREPDQTADELLIRHLKTENLEIINEIIKGNYKGIPGNNKNNILIYQNNVFKFISRLLKLYKESVRPIVYKNNEYKTIAELFQKRPNIKGISNKELKDSEKGSKTPFREIEDSDKAEIKDPVVQKLLKKGVNINNLIKIEYDCDYCGDSSPSSWLESYILNQLSFVFLQVKNISNKLVTLQSYKDSINKGDFEWCSLKDILLLEGNQQEMPKLKIEKDETILIPQLVFIEPYEFTEETILESKSVYNDDPTYYQTISHIINFTARLDGIQFGPSDIVKYLEYNVEGQVGQTIRIHDFDNKNLFIADRHWAVGSCPHIYVLENSNKWKYYGETAYSLDLKFFQHIIADKSQHIIIAELEKEVTFLEQITLSDNLRNIFFQKENVQLIEGERLTINIPVHKKGPFLLEIIGYHKPVFYSPQNRDQVYVKGTRAKHYTFRLNKERFNCADSS